MPSAPRTLRAYLHGLAAIYEALHDRFRADCYRDAAVVLAMQRPLPRTHAALTTLPGVGASIAHKVVEFQRTGQVQKWHTLQADARIQARIALLRVVGIGPVTAKALVDQHGVDGVAGLRQAVDSGSVALTHAQTLGLRHFEDLRRRIPFAEARRLDEALQRWVRAERGRSRRRRLAPTHTPSSPELHLVGSFRRRSPTLGDIDVLMKHLPIEALLAHLRATPRFDVVGVLSRGSQKASLLLRIDRLVRRVDVLVASPAEYVPALVYFTGSKAFNIYMRAIARTRGWSLSEHGLTRAETEKKVVKTARVNAGRCSDRPTRTPPQAPAPVFHTERELFDFLGMKWVRPERRGDAEG